MIARIIIEEGKRGLRAKISDAEDATEGIFLDSIFRTIRRMVSQIRKDSGAPEPPPTYVAPMPSGRPPLTRLQLDLMLAGGCQIPGCDCEETLADKNDIYFHGACHPSAPTWTRYLRDGRLLVECSACRQTIAEVAVAKTGE